MLIDLSDVSPIRKQIEVEIPAEAVDREFRDVTGEFARQAKVPGFRPGKTPLSVVKTRFRTEIEGEVLDRLLPKYFSEALSGKDLEPVGNPGLKKMDPIKEGQAVRFVAEFEVKPAVRLGEYRGIEVTESPFDVSEEEIDQVIERFRDRASTFSPILDRPAQDGDWVVVDIVSEGEGVERRTSEGYHLQLGEEAPLPELNDALRGKSVGDETSFEKVYGEDAPNEQVRNKTVRYELKVRELKKLDKPALDDDFAKSTSLGETVAELRQRVREDLERHKKHDAQQVKRQQVGEALVERHELEVPQAMLGEEMNRTLRNYARYLQSQGVDLEKAQLDWEKIGRDLEPEAVKRVKRSLILEAIAKKEGLEVSETEVDAEIRKATAGTDEEYAEVRHRLRADGGYEALRNEILQEKALEMLIGAAVVVPAKG